MRKVCSAILVLFLPFLITTPAHAVEDSPSSRATLKGLPGVIVSVPNKTGCEHWGVSGQSIKAEVQTQLKEVGVKVIYDTEGKAVLRIVYLCFSIPSSELINYFVSVRLDRGIPWDNLEGGVEATTWSSGLGVGVTVLAEIRKDLRREIRGEISQFAGAWLSVNGE